MKLKVLCIGDIVGRPGRRILAHRLSDIKEKYDIDCVIANAENAAGGSGITPQIYKKLFRYGINLVTLGDHTYKKKEIIPVLESETNIARPENLSRHSAGSGVAYYKTGAGPVVGVISLIGRVFMKPADCPYHAVDKLLPKVKQEADIIFVDIHAEATSEKIALGYHLDGKVSCVFGTHTHVQTADEKILKAGTGYITDIGMTGAHDSILGRDKDNVLKSFRTQMPFPYGIATDDVKICGIVATIDTQTKHTEKIERIAVTAEVDKINYDSDDGKPQNYSGI